MKNYWLIACVLFSSCCGLIRINTSDKTINESNEQLYQKNIITFNNNKTFVRLESKELFCVMELKKSNIASFVAPSDSVPLWITVWASYCEPCWEDAHLTYDYFKGRTDAAHKILSLTYTIPNTYNFQKKYNITSISYLLSRHDYPGNRTEILPLFLADLGIAGTYAPVLPMNVILYKHRSIVLQGSITNTTIDSVLRVIRQ